MLPHSRAVLVAFALGLATAAAFARAPFFGFTNYDDQDYASDNPQVRAGLSWDGARWAFTATHAANWHPLTWLSLQLDSSLWHAHPGGYHLTNVLLHVANTVLLFAALQRMTGALWRSALVAALFGLHPLHVESVVWISERKDVLSTFFWMLALWLYAGYAARPGWGRYLLVALAFALGLLAKPMLVTLPFVLLLLDYWPLGRLPRRAGRGSPLVQGAAPDPVPGGFRAPLALVLEKLPLFLIAAASCAMTLYAQQKAGAVQSLERFAFPVRAANAVMTYAGYLRKMLWPSDLALFYPHPGAALPTWQVIGAAIVLLGITGLALVWARRRPYWTVGWLWYLGTLVPVIGLVQVGAQAMADRYTYVPLVGVFIMLSWGLGELAARRPALAPASGVLLLACFACTWRQVGIWRDNVTLWEHALAVTDDNYMAHQLLGRALIQEGKPHEATEHFRQAVHIKPDDYIGRVNFGLYLETQWGRTEEARAELAEALRQKPDSPAANLNMGYVLDRLGRTDQAEAYYRKAAGAPEDYRDYVTAQVGLGKVLVKLGRAPEAVPYIRAAVEKQPASAALRYLLADALAKSGQSAEAAAELRAAQELEAQP